MATKRKSKNTEEPKTLSEILAAVKAAKSVGHLKVDAVADIIKSDPSTIGVQIGTGEIKAILAAQGFKNEQPGEVRDNPELIRIGKGLAKKGVVRELPREKGDAWKWEIV